MRNLVLLPVLLTASAIGYGIKQYNLDPPTVSAIAVDAKGNVVATTSVNEKGKFKFENLPAGTYDFKIVSKNYSDTLLLKNIEANKGIAEYKAELKFKVPVVVSGVKKTDDTIELGLTDGDGDYYRGDYKMEFGKGAESPAYAPAPSIAVGRSAKSTTDGSSEYVSGDPESKDAAQKAGQLTAGQWRDLDNWEKWFSTNNAPEIKAYQSAWGMFPAQRFAFDIADKNKKPLIAAKVELINAAGNVEWTTTTDNLGRAELWPTLFQQNPENNKYTLQITANEQTEKFTKITYGNTIQKLAVKFESKPEMAADIAFVVDATGSMGDEISYLQAEIMDVITRAQKNANCINLKLGSVFYRDNGDEYLTKKTDFNNNFLEVSDFLMEQSAGGGGDFPEAVDAAMEAAIDGLQWRPNAVAKIMFLVLDAPPHPTQESVEKMKKYTRLAAAKGIKIIPVASSGIDQTTEFLMKYLAIATNGNYVYLTDHSAIGNSHIKPTGVKEDVQFLNEVLLKIINDNLKIEGCEIENNNNNTLPSVVEIKTNGQWQVQFYPNPSVNEIKLKSTDNIEEVTLVSLHGQTLINKKYDSNTKELKLDVSNLSNGIYVVNVRKGTETVSCKMMVYH